MLNCILFIPQTIGASKRGDGPSYLPTPHFSTVQVRPGTVIRREKYWVKDPYKDYLVYLDYLFPFGFTRTVIQTDSDTNVRIDPNKYLRYSFITIILCEI